MPDSEEIDNVPNTLLSMNFLLITVAVMLCESLLRPCDPWRRSLAIVALIPVLILVIVLMLGVIGALSAVSVTILFGGGFTVLGFLKWKVWEDEFVRNAFLFNLRDRQKILHAFALFLVVIAGAFVIG
jgi:hypothetical protein